MERGKARVVLVGIDTAAGVDGFLWEDSVREVKRANHLSLPHGTPIDCTLWSYLGRICI